MAGRKYLKKLNWNGWIERESDKLDLYLFMYAKIGAIHRRRRTACCYFLRI